VTDRALRYRAAAHAPPPSRRCCLCGSGRNIEVGHINGDERDSAPRNLFWTCRRCNVVCANVLHAAGIGKFTRQFNAAGHGETPVPDEFLVARARAAAGGGRIHGAEQLIASYRVFGQILKRRPDDRESRRKFYETEAKLRQFNPAQGASNLRQWLMAVMTVTGQAPQMGVADAVQLIRSTAPAERSAFAAEIWRRRRQRAQ
jgi:hypothetical protein